MSTLTDLAGRTLTRSQAERMATDCIERQRDTRPIVEEYVRGLTDCELMAWCAYPDTGEFPEREYELVTTVLTMEKL